MEAVAGSSRLWGWGLGASRVCRAGTHERRAGLTAYCRTTVALQYLLLYYSRITMLTALLKSHYNAYCFTTVALQCLLLYYSRIATHTGLLSRITMLTTSLQLHCNAYCFRRPSRLFGAPRVCCDGAQEPRAGVETLHSEPSALHPQPSTLNSQHSTLNAQHFTLNSPLSTLKPQQLTLNN